jgi:NADPH-dependent 2,4-dienoyl-CoA reductase/sulfur reductase-like enzyme
LTQSKYLILGGGMVAGFAAKEMAENGLAPGELTIVSADDAPPYHRPPLSKGFLAGEEDVDEILINDEGFYRDHGIDLRLGMRIEAVDLAGRTVRTGTGGEIGFERMLIATGAIPRPLEVPGTDLPGVHLLRTLADSREIRSAAEPGMKAVVVGAGFIGTEVAAVLAEDGLDVTLVYRGQRLLQKLFTPEMSRYYESVFREHGVTLRPNSGVARFVGNGSVSAVQATGDRLDADLVVVGVGVAPATELFRGGDLEIDDGIVVDERLATDIEGIWAAGDVARYKDVLFDTHRRVEHWDNAVEQGKVAGRNLVAGPGGGEVFDHLPYFFSDAFDLSWELWGDPSRGDEVVIRGGLEDGSFSAWWLSEDSVPVAAFVMDRPDAEREAAQELIRERKRIGREALADPGRPLPTGA